jgi:hypothetical protein
MDKWKERLAGVEGMRVGVVWQGNPRFGWDHFRSFPLAALAPLAAVAGVRLVSLQKGPGVEQLRADVGKTPALGQRSLGSPSGLSFPQGAVLDLGDELDADGAFLDTAAVMLNLDLVVTADTAAAHLAGALSVPVWVAVAAVADWRWGVGHQTTPWYPTMRLFRQQRLYDWAGLFQAMAEELEAWARRHNHPPRDVVPDAVRTSQEVHGNVKTGHR